MKEEEERKKERKKEREEERKKERKKEREEDYLNPFFPIANSLTASSELNGWSLQQHG